MKLVFLGTPRVATAALDALVDSGHRVVGVITRADRPVGRYWYNKHLSGSHPDRQSFFDYCFVAPEICRQGKTLTSITGHGPAYQLDAGLLGVFLMEMSKKSGHL